MLRAAAGLSGGGTAAYRYYADGTRREKTAGGMSAQFLYMGGLGYLTEEDTEFAADQEIAEYDGSTLLRRYLRLPGSIDEPFLMLDYGGPGCGSGCQTWAHQNRLGSVAATTDDAGAVVDKFTYSSYGVSGGSASGFPFRFTGQKLDPETGLYYYKARYYDPETGRFLQTDPIGYEDQMNLYAYVANDPINKTDPTGECGALILHCLGAAGGAVAGLVGEVISVATGGEASVGGFAGAISGGGAAGAVFVQSGGNLAAAGAVAGAIDSTVRQAVDGTIANGGDIGKGIGSINVAEVATETAVGAVSGKVPLPKVPGITAGRGSITHVANTQKTMLVDQGRNISGSTAAKITGAGAIGDTPEALAAAASGPLVDAVGDAASNATLGNAANCALGANGCQ